MVVGFLFYSDLMGQSIFDMFLTGRLNMIYCILLLMTIRIKNDYRTSSALV